MSPSEENYDDEEVGFPDEDEEHIDEEESVEPSIDSGVGPNKLDMFLEDPWPRLTFLNLIIGLALVLITPPDFWATWRYLLFANYLLIVFATVGIVFGLKIWKAGGSSNLRYGGPTNALVIIACAIVGVADSVSWMVNGSSIIVGWPTSIIASMLMIIIFCFYTLWLIQRVITSGT